MNWCDETLELSFRDHDLIDNVSVPIDIERKAYGIFTESVVDIDTYENQERYRHVRQNTDQIDILNDELYNCIQLICENVTDNPRITTMTNVDIVSEFPCFTLFCRYTGLLFELDMDSCAIQLHSFIDGLLEHSLYPDFIREEDSVWIQSFIRHTLSTANEHHLNSVPHVPDDDVWLDITPHQLEPIIMELAENIHALNTMFNTIGSIVYEYDP